jgi:hypothetical protein
MASIINISRTFSFINVHFSKSKEINFLVLIAVVVVIIEGHAWTKIIRTEAPVPCTRYRCEEK